MTLLAPIWLLGLLPWAAAVVALLVSRRPPARVPFLSLWRLNAPREAVRRRYTVPPAGVVLGLLAALAAILAAAGPATRVPGTGVLTVVLDAGATMSARGDADLRFREAAVALASLLRDTGRADAAIEWVVVPVLSEPSGRPGDFAGRRVVAADLPAAAADVPATALDTRAALDHALRVRLADASARVVVLTDQPIAVPTDRLVQVTPAGAGANVGIRHLAVRQSPVPQAMVRLHRSGPAGGGGVRPVVIRLTSAGRTVERQAESPPAGGTCDVFVDLPAAGDVVSAELVGPADAFPGDDRAHVAAESDWPTIEPVVPVGELQRLIDLYAAGRPAGDRSIRVRLVPPPVGDGGSGAAIILPALAGPTAPARPTQVADHPITRAVGDWGSLAVPAAIDRTLPEGSWDVVLGDRSGALVAVRDTAGVPGVATRSRSVWTAVDPRGWANRAEYVTFWSAVFDWAGRVDAGDGGNLSSAPLAEISPAWRAVERAPGPERVAFWSGLYERRGDGRRRAFGPAETVAGGIVIAPAEQADRLSQLLRQGDRLIPWSPWLLVTAGALTVAAAAGWPARARTSRDRQDVVRRLSKRAPVARLTP